MKNRIIYINRSKRKEVEPQGLNIAEFTYVVIPDVHLMYKCSYDDFEAMFTWVKNYARTENIRFVSQLGDLGDIRGTGSFPGIFQEAKSRIQPLLDSGVPFGFCAGNHDVNEKYVERDYSYFTQADTFGRALYEGKYWFGDTFENMASAPGVFPCDTLNHYSTLDIAGRKFLFLTLEFGTRNKVMAWADNLVKNLYPNHEVIVFTHSYLHRDGQRVESGTQHSPHGYDMCSTQPGDEYSNTGNEMWEKWMKYWANLKAVHSGHTINEPTQAHQISIGESGNVVQEFFMNWQNWAIDGNGDAVYGSGDYTAAWVRMFKVNITENGVTVENYIPAGDIKDEPTPIPETHTWY